LVRAQLTAFGMEKVTCRGERVMLRTEAVQNIALALHELATNASKYGALSAAPGKVEIDWAWDAGEMGERNLRVTWRETGGPPVTAPSKKGFGCFVLERVTVNALGQGGLEFKPEGLVWTCTIHPEHLIDGDNAADAAATGQQAAAGAQPRQLN
jgi:two-component sensor histidine kinase